MVTETSVGIRIRRFRRRRGWSQEELAARAGLSPRTISDLERGLRLPGYKTLSALARAISEPVDRFFDEDCRSNATATVDGEAPGRHQRLLRLLGEMDDVTLEVAIAQIEALRRLHRRP